MVDDVMSHARLLAEWCLDVSPGEEVVIRAHPRARPLITALYEVLGAHGVTPVTVHHSKSDLAAHFSVRTEEYTTPNHYRSLYKATDAILSIQSDPEWDAFDDLPERIRRQRRRANRPLMDAFLKKGCVTQHPIDAFADRAGLSYAEYRRVFYDAVRNDWEQLNRENEVHRRRLDDASEVRITGEGTSLELRVDGMRAVSDDGRSNFPGGEVYTAPVVDSVMGRIRFDVPIYHGGTVIRDAYLEFDNGEVTTVKAAAGERHLRELVETDEGSNRVGEFGVGTNAGIDRPTLTPFLDEKMAGTVHLALGRAYEATVGADARRNESSIHVDLITTVDEGTVAYDDTVVIDGGTFTYDLPTE